MAQFRIETVFDDATKLFAIELYYPDTETIPQFVSKPIYISHEHATQSAIETFKQAIPDKPVEIVKKSKR